jgi:hypothetical protein
MHAVYKMRITKHIAQKKVPVNRKESTFLFVLLNFFDVQEHWTIRRNNKEFPPFERDSIQLRPWRFDVMSSVT